MLTVSLTSIPPRFSQIHSTLHSLLRQSIPVRIVVSLPRSYRRYPGEVFPPDLPEGVNLHRSEIDHGPATKLLGVLDQVEGDILYCDDDCIYEPDWAQEMLAARSANHAVAASAFSVKRLKRSAPPGQDQVAQGFAGVLVRSNMFGPEVFDLPSPAYASDDVWLSGCLAHRGVAISPAPKAREFCTPLPDRADQLQDRHVEGYNRAEANIACADSVTRRFGIWPEMG